MIEKRPLGRAGIDVPQVCLGTMTFGAQVDEPTARSMVDLCLERDVNFLDTANVYNNGRTEEILGRILAGRRERFVLASKVGVRNDQLPAEGGLSRAAITTAIENSLRRLNTDYLDLYYFHQPDYSVPLEDSLTVMAELVQSGKVRFFVASNYAAWQLVRMLWLAEKNHWPQVVGVQPMYNLLARRIESELLPMTTAHGLAVIPYNPLAGGLLTGKHEIAAPIAGSRFDRLPFYRDRYWNPENFAAVQRLSQIARDAGRSLPELAIGWLAQQPAVTSIILGASTLAQLEQNLAAMEKGSLSQQSLAACDEVWAALRGISPAYNR